MALSVACSEDAPTSSGFTHSSHPSQGTYTNSSYNTSATVTVNNDGTCSIRGNAIYESEYQNFDITITKWYQPNSSSSCYAGSANGMLSFVDIEQS